VTDAHGNDPLGTTFITLKKISCKIRQVPRRGRQLERNSMKPPETSPISTIGVRSATASAVLPLAGKNPDSVMRLAMNIQWDEYAV